MVRQANMPGSEKFPDEVPFYDYQIYFSPGKTYTFDYEHRLTEINGGGSSEAFSYDGAGNRLRGVQELRQKSLNSRSTINTILTCF